MLVEGLLEAGWDACAATGVSEALVAAAERPLQPGRERHPDGRRGRLRPACARSAELGESGAGDPDVLVRHRRDAAAGRSRRARSRTWPSRSRCEALLALRQRARTSTVSHVIAHRLGLPPCARYRARRSHAAWRNAFITSSRAITPTSRSPCGSTTGKLLLRVAIIFSSTRESRRARLHDRRLAHHHARNRPAHDLDRRAAASRPL